MNEWVWSNGGMILTGENWSTGRKTLYSVSGRWMNEYGAMVEWYWQGKTEVLGGKHYTAWVVEWLLSSLLAIQVLHPAISPVTDARYFKARKNTSSISRPVSITCSCSTGPSPNSMQTKTVTAVPLLAV